MKAKTIITTALLCCIGFASCQKDDLDVLNPNEQLQFVDWRHAFESFWNGMNYGYAFWDVDTTDWDQVYYEYAPKFDGLKFWNSEDSITAYELFNEICEGLIDHHFYLQLKDQHGQQWKLIIPSHYEVKSRDYFHFPYSLDALALTINENFAQGRISNFCSVTTEDGFSIRSYLLDGDIVYLGFSQFSIISHISDERVKATLNNYYNLINVTTNLKGIIIDTRVNGGGSTADMKYVLTPLISDRVVFGYTRAKNGLGRLDYTPYSPLELYPLPADENPVKRNVDNIHIVALADIHSASMGEITPMAIMAMPNGTFVGERTWGAHGPLAGDIQLFYSGTLENNTFLMYTSTSMTTRVDGKCYEGHGIEPDIEALLDEEAFNNGNDTQLDRAAQFIHTGK